MAISPSSRQRSLRSTRRRCLRRWQTDDAAMSAPKPWLETLRLELRDFVSSDFDDLYRLDSDPRVMKYIGDGRPLSRARILQLLTRTINYPKLYPDLGIWRASLRGSGEFVGWFSLKYAGKSTDIEVGYRL